MALMQEMWGELIAKWLSSSTRICHINIFQNLQKMQKRVQISYTHKKAPTTERLSGLDLFGGDGWGRTTDLGVMNPTL